MESILTQKYLLQVISLLNNLSEDIVTLKGRNTPEHQRQAIGHERKYYSVKDAAVLYSTSVRTLYRLQQSKGINFYKFGGRTLVKIQELESLVQMIRITDKLHELKRQIKVKRKNNVKSKNKRQNVSR